MRGGRSTSVLPSIFVSLSYGARSEDASILSLVEVAEKPLRGVMEINRWGREYQTREKSEKVGGEGFEPPTLCV